MSCKDENVPAGPGASVRKFPASMDICPADACRRDDTSGGADGSLRDRFPEGTSDSSPARPILSQTIASWSIPSHLLPLVVALLLLLGGCGPTRCLNVAAFGNLGPQVNSPYDDYGPALSDPSSLVFTSNRIEPGEGGLQQFYQTVRPTRLFFTMRLEQNWDDAQLYRLLFNANGDNSEAATISFAPAGSPFNTAAYISACTRSDTVGGCDLYAVVERQTSSLVNLGKEINSTSWDGHPFVTRDGMRLYFASDRPGGQGGIDIWYSERLSTGAWGSPRNAGPAINSPRDEFSPFMDNATGHLFFASQTSNAGIDIFVLDRGSDARRRLPSPYNSDDDDFTPFLMEGNLYLASNRAGGCGGYDLYGFAIADAATGSGN